MKELDLYRFINEENNLEYRWVDDKEVILFISVYQVKEFNELLDPSVYDDNGITCVMRDGYFAFDMSRICEYYDIELERIFPKDEPK